MTIDAKAGMVVILAAAILGVLSDTLLNIFPWGINASIWIAALVLGVLLISRRMQIDLKGGGRWLLLPAIGFAVLIAWRGSLTLQTTNILAVVVVLSIAAARSRTGQVRMAGMKDYITAHWNLAMNAIFGPFTV